MSKNDVILTGVISANNIAWEFVDNEICLDCEEAFKEIEEIQDCPECEALLDEDGECPECGWDKQKEYDMVECSDHEKLIGDWLKDEEGKYYPDETKEFAAIVTSSTFNCVQVVWSKFTKEVRAMCSPCFPNQADLDSGDGNIKCYDLPPYLYYNDDEYGYSEQKNFD